MATPTTPVTTALASPSTTEDGTTGGTAAATTLAALPTTTAQTTTTARPTTSAQARPSTTVISMPTAATSGRDRHTSDGARPEIAYRGMIPVTPPETMRRGRVYGGEAPFVPVEEDRWTPVHLTPTPSYESLDDFLGLSSSDELGPPEGDPVVSRPRIPHTPGHRSRPY